MLPTPSTSHLSPYEHLGLYEPSEDSFLVLDTLSLPSETSFLHSRFSTRKSKDADTPTPLVVEIGTSTGILSAFLLAQSQALFGRDDVCVLATDVNPNAPTSARHTVTLALEDGRESTTSKVFDPLLCSLLPPLLPNSLDLLVYNPPYVPTETVPSASTDSLSASDLLELTWAGGPQGTSFTLPVLEQLPRILSERGVAYVLFCARNDVDAVESWWLRDVVGLEDGIECSRAWGWEVVGCSGRKAGWERLVVVRVWRKL